MQHIVQIAVQLWNNALILTVTIFGCQNNSTLIHDAPLLKSVAFNLALFDTALFDAVLFNV